MKSRALFRKIFPIILIFSISSCQSGPGGQVSTSTAVIQRDEETQNQPENKVKVQTTPSDQKGNTIEKIPGDMKIVFWYPFAGEMADVIDDLINQYNTENRWENQIVGEPHADQDVMIGDLNVALDQVIEIPDVIISSSQSLQTWYSEGYPIKELDAYLQLLADEEGEYDLPQIFPIFWDIDVVNGKRIGIPAYQSGQFLFYNQTWGEELGFSAYPQNAEEFQKQICFAESTNRFDNNVNNDGTGGWIYNGGSLSLLAWMKSFDGGDLVNSRSQPILTEPENIAALQFLYDLYNADCAWTGKQQQPYLYFSDRLALIYSGQMEDILHQLQVDKMNDNSDKWELIPYPPSEGKPVVMVKGSSFAITSRDDAHAMAALDFIRWILKPENQKKIIERTGVFPLFTETIDLIDSNLPLYSIWKDSLQYLPYAQPEPIFEGWYSMKKVLNDVGWQLIQYTIQPENIESILMKAEKILNEVDELSE